MAGMRLVPVVRVLRLASWKQTRGFPALVVGRTGIVVPLSLTQGAFVAIVVRWIFHIEFSKGRAR